MSDALPVITILKSVMTVQSYLQAVTFVALPAVITTNVQNADLATQFTKWQSEVWDQFWEGLVSGVSAESSEVNSCFEHGLGDQATMKRIFYRGPVPAVVAQCDELADFVATGSGLVQQMQAIADSIEGADQADVDKYTALVTQLQNQFSTQEDTLTQDALGSARDIVSTAVQVMVAVGTEGAVSEPLAKGVIKIGTDVVNELVLTDDINQTLGELESAWQSLDAASADLAQITLFCNKLKAVTDQSAETLTGLADLSGDWNAVASSAQAPAADWSGGGSAALQQWAAEMVRITFAYASQSVNASIAG